MSSLLTDQPSISVPTSESVPHLENGDCLTAPEFHRRYAAMPHVKKAELIRGIVYMGSPVRFEYHGMPHVDLATWIGNYKAFTPGTVAGDNSTMKLDKINEPQPDICLAIKSECGGQSKLIDGYMVGAPELIAEIVASSASYDLHQKRDVYAEFSVREYLVWRALEGELDWFLLDNGRFEPLAADSDAIFRSRVFPGLWLAARSLLAGDLAHVHAVLQAGLADPSHRAFVTRLGSNIAE